MKERLGMQFDPIDNIPTFQGKEYPRNYTFFDVEPQDGQIIGHARDEHVDIVLVWDQGTVIGMSRERYDKYKS